ncbi:DUF4123 domain-containing protein [Polyangium fumosum]|nr:DUF4123 domain-containing protein [Polyangium fumosum]
MTMYDRVADLLIREAAPIFAIMDGARDRAIPRALHGSGFRHQSLYDGRAAEELGSFGPYLIELGGDAQAIEDWVRTGWGKSFGVYLACDQPFDVVRRHLRRFTLVELKNGRKAYFRFYDPRVLRLFLPHCTYEEWIQFFGPIGTFFAESEDAKSLLRFFRDAEEPEPTCLALESGS